MRISRSCPVAVGKGIGLTGSLQFSPMYASGRKLSVLALLCWVVGEANSWSSRSLPLATGSGSQTMATATAAARKHVTAPRPRIPLVLSSSTIDATEESSETTAKTTASVAGGSSSSITNSRNHRDNETLVLADDDTFVKPARDPRQYRVLKLANNLQVLIVSDQLASGAVGVEAASVHVQAGHFDDTIPGLAHFHEHMLFLGTEKYPDEDEYETFLSQFGGFSNAYTDMEDTNYFFCLTTPNTNPNVTSDALSGALDRLAQFFVAPLFDPDATERECKAIDSEYRNGKASDNWRNYQLIKSTCNDTHPFAKFGCGNYDTLKTQAGLEHLLGELQRFWDRYYQTYNLRLAVVGHASLDALQATVEETFGTLAYSEGAPRRVKRRVGNKEDGQDLFVRENAVYGVPAYGPDQLGVLRRIIPFTESRTIKLLFGAPPLDDPAVTTSKPYRVLSHILGHEGPGSLHAVLNDAGYLTGLSSGIGIDTSDFALFSLSMSLTPLGMRNYPEVLDLTFQWIVLVRSRYESDPQWFEAHHEELRQISEVNFRFRENGDPTDFCSSASELLFDEQMEYSRILKGGSETSLLDPVVTKAFLDRFRPENAMVHIVSSDLKTTSSDESNGSTWETEPWYGAQFQAERLSSEQIETWGSYSPETIDARLALPGLNNYIPTDFSLRCDEEVDAKKETLTSDEIMVPPVLVLDRPNLRLWHKMDRYWRVPKAFIRVAILSPNVYRSPRSMTYNRIFQRVLSDDLNSFVYDASIAGCNYRVSCAPSGYRISVRGYSEKLPFLLETLMSRILSLIQEMKGGDPDLRKRFAKAQESLLRETKNYRLDTPYEVASYNSRLLIEENVWYLDNYVDEMEGDAALHDPLTMEECAQVAEDCVMGRLKCEALCMGNIDQKHALGISEVLDRVFLDKSRTISEVETPRFRSLKLPTRDEASLIFGDAVVNRTLPMIYADLAHSASEENNAVEVILQAGSELELGYEGLATLDLITHMAYNSAFNQLRTKEQLGYTVSAFPRKTAGTAWGLSVVVMGSAALPEYMEERCEAWLVQFRRELEAMTPDAMAVEASAIVAQLLEEETKLSQEVSRVWGEILNTETLTDRLRTPNFGRLERLTEELVTDANAKQSPVELKQRVLDFFDARLASSSPARRAMSSRVYSQAARAEYDGLVGQPGVLSSYADMRHVKQFLSSYAHAPYWRIETPSLTTNGLVGTMEK
jgi:insulysin